MVASNGSGRPPHYVETDERLPTYDEATKKAALRDIARAEETVTPIEVPVFNTLVRIKNDPKAKWKRYGRLALGTYSPLGILRNYVAYQPVALDEDDEDEESEPEWADISSSVQVMDDLGDKSGTHYRKVAEPSLSPYSFDIVVNGFGENGSFVGTFTTTLPAAAEHEWKGKYAESILMKPKVTKPPDIPKPDNLKGTLQGLHALTPFAWKTDGEIKAGEDGAQVKGDKLWQRISMHAVDSGMKEKVLRNLDPLNDAERELLKKHPNFFHRFSIHELAERLKKTVEMPDDIRQHILYKKLWFMKMMTSYAAPAKGSNLPDPVVQYGWDREKNKKEIDTLQREYLSLTIESYEMGYKAFVPQWMTYLEEPEYWYKVFTNFLESKEFLEGWVHKLPDRDKIQGAMPVQIEVMHWANKLTLLKHAVARIDPKKANELDPETTVSKINTYLTIHFTWAQVITEELVQHLEKILEDLNQKGEDFAEEFDKMSKDHKEIFDRTRLWMAVILRRALKDDSPLAKLLRRRSRSFHPPIPSAHGLSSPKHDYTFGEVMHALEQIRDDHETRTDEMEMSVLSGPALAREVEGTLAVAEAVGEIPSSKVRNLLSGLKDSAMDAIKGTREYIMDNIKKLSFWGKVAKAAMFAGSTIWMAVEFVKKYRGMDMLTLWYSSLQLGVIAADWTGRVARFVSTKVYAYFDFGRKFTGKLVGWLTSNAVERTAGLGKRFRHAFVGSFAKVLRIVGLVASVLGVIMIQNELSKAQTMNEKDRNVFTIFNRIQFYLATFEVVAMVSEIGFEILGMTAAATVAGALGTVAGVLGIVVMVVYLVAFAPNPWQFAEDWLKDDGKKVGSYDPDKIEKPESEPGIKPPEEKPVSENTSEKGAEGHPPWMKLTTMPLYVDLK